MKIGIMISSLLLTIAVISGCADVSSSNKEVNLKEKNTVNEKKAIKTSTNEENAETMHEVGLDHLKIYVSSKWGVKKGLDSASFTINDKTVGMIEGLAYADTWETLLPNQSIVTDKQQLTQLPFEAYQVTISSDAVQTKTKKETHIYIFIEPKKEVYDLHFDANLVDETKILKIVHSAEIIDTE